ncbi:hypothetical protein LFM09_29625 [Lentzea alba]|uniref:hypothetical protein n=1 Tax=Lentzea alba TaxID=2714351 RepID=UPI0039BFF3EA
MAGRAWVRPGARGCGRARVGAAGRAWVGGALVGVAGAVGVPESWVVAGVADGVGVAGVVGVPESCAWSVPCVLLAPKVLAGALALVVWLVALALPGARGRCCP